MSRRTRADHPGYWYHVIVHGNARWRIFSEAPWKDCYLELLGREVSERRLQVGAFCLMPTHAHLLLKRTTLPLWTGMHRVQSVFAHRYNKPRNRVGHVFQDRYQAYVVTHERYLRHLVCHMHKNPVRAGLAGSVEDYEYSSHAFYATGATRFAFLSAVPGFGGCTGRARYLALAGQPGAGVPVPRVGSYIGTESDVRRVDPDAIADRRAPGKVVAAHVARFCHERGVTIRDLRVRTKKQPVAGIRTEIMAQLHECGYSATVVGRYFGITDAAVHEAVRRKKLRN